MGEKFLEIKDLNVTYTQNRKNVYAVNGISIRLERGKTWDWWERPEPEKLQSQRR